MIWTTFCHAQRLGAIYRAQDLTGLGCPEHPQLGGLLLHQGADLIGWWLAWEGPREHQARHSRQPYHQPHRDLTCHYPDHIAKSSEATSDPHCCADK